MTKKIIAVADEFTRAPIGRKRTDGPYSGERFREEFLYPALIQYDEVEVLLDGTLGYGSSFLDEAFGGLIRENHIPLQEIMKKLIITSRRKIYKDKALQYLKENQALCFN